MEECSFEEVDVDVEAEDTEGNLIKKISIQIYIPKKKVLAF